MQRAIDKRQGLQYNTSINSEEEYSMRTVNGIQQGPQERENVLFGIVGAFLFSLVGGALWYVLYQVGFLAGVSGIVGVICAIRNDTGRRTRNAPMMPCTMTNAVRPQPLK